MSKMERKYRLSKWLCVVDRMFRDGTSDTFRGELRKSRRFDSRHCRTQQGQCRAVEESHGQTEKVFAIAAILRRNLGL